MSRFLDHLVLPVRDLGQSRRRLEALGFTVAPDARHPFGTGNACVFFQNRTYLEPLAIVEEAAAERAVEGRLFFVAQASRFLTERGEGLAMVALREEDAEAAHRTFETAGFSAGRMFQFKRMAVLPDGAEREIGVKLAYAADPRAPDAAVFACEPVGASVNSGVDYIDHPNTALGVSAVAAVAQNPADFHIFLSAVTGERELRSTSFAIEAKLGDITISIMTPRGFEALHGLSAPDPRDGLLFAGFEVAVRDLDSIPRLARGFATRHAERVVVAPTPGFGAILAFREAGQ